MRWSEEDSGSSVSDVWGVGGGVAAEASTDDSKLTKALTPDSQSWRSDKERSRTAV